MALAVCALTAMIGILVLVFRHSSASQELTDKLARLESDKHALEEKRDGLQRELQDARLSLRDQRQQPPIAVAAPADISPQPVATGSDVKPKIPEPPDPQDVAKSWWQASVEKNFAGFDDDFVRLQKSNARAAVLVAGWKRPIRGLYNDAKVWFSSDSRVSDLYREASAEPWDGTKLRAARTYLDDLDTAAKTWDAWAADSHMNDARLLQAIPGQPPRVAAILQRWHGQVAGRTKWTLRLTSGAAKTKAFGKTRDITLCSGDDEPSTGVHEWNNAMLHVYDPKSNASELHFTWAPDDPVQMIVEGDWSFWLAGARSNLIDKTFAGPLAVCALHKAGRVDEGGLTIRFEVVDCPGPPRDWRKNPMDIVDTVTKDK